MPLQPVVSGRARLVGVELEPGREAQVGAVGAVAGEDVGDVGAVALEVDRVGVGRHGAPFGQDSPTKS